MVWVYVIAAVVIFLLLKKLIRLPTVGRYGERYVFITGCDTGFGNGLAKRLDCLGFNVFAGCFTERGADDLRKASSARLKTVSLDVTKLESILKARETVEKQIQADIGLWAIVNNAGVSLPFAHAELFTRSDYEACLNVNLYGAIEVTRVFLPLLRKSRGRIVNMSSIVGRLAVTNAPYVVSKYGVEAFSDCLRREVLKQGMSVHIIEPGAFKTEFVDNPRLKRELQKTYDRASPELQRYYGRDYVDKVTAAITPAFEQASAKSHMVVEAYTHAITAMFPRPRYIVGTDAKYFYPILWNLPECISDWIWAHSMFSTTPEGAK